MPNLSQPTEAGEQTTADEQSSILNDRINQARELVNMITVANKRLETICAQVFGPLPKSDENETSAALNSKGYIVTLYHTQCEIEAQLSYLHDLIAHLEQL